MAKTKEILVNGQLTQVTEFDHSAQEIDDAVDKVNGGYATPITDARTATKTGLYYIGNVDPAISHVPFKYVMLEVKAQSDRFIVQYLWRWNAQGYKMKCVYDSGTWGEWEWENPPMELGVEYRTTERSEGKPVYARAVDVGAVTANTQASWMDTNCPVACVVEAFAVGYNNSSDSTYTTPFKDKNVNYELECCGLAYSRSDKNRLSVFVNSTFNLDWCHATVKYTKETD